MMDASRERRLLLSLTAQLLLAELSFTVLSITDIYFISALGVEQVSAAGLIGALVNCLFLFSVGLLSAVEAVAARDYASRERPERAVAALWAAGLVALSLGTFALLLALLVDVPRLLGVPAWLADGAQLYVLLIAAAFGLNALLAAQWSWLASIGRPSAVLPALAFGILLNAGLAGVLVQGQLGLPRLGLLGAGLASLLASLGMVLLALGQARRWRERVDPQARCVARDLLPALGAVLRLGLPIGCIFLLQMGLFSAVTLLTEDLGSVVVAAQAVVLQIAVVPYLFSYCLGQAATIRVAHWHGRALPQRLRHCVQQVVLIGLSGMALLALLLVCFRAEIAALFFAPRGGTSQAHDLVARTLVVVAAIHLVDGGQAIALGVLRGLGSGAQPAALAIFCYWVLGLGSAYHLGMTQGLGLPGLWLGIGLGLGAALLVFTLWARRLLGDVDRALMPAGRARA